MSAENVARMPARKRVRPAAVKRDPVITALIAKIPPEAAEWSYADRINWLRMMAMAFDGAFGGGRQIVVDILNPADPPLRASSEGAKSMPAFSAAPAGLETRYFIDTDGYARRNPGGVRIKATQIPTGETLWDERPDGEQDLEAIIFADGTWPTAALPPLSIASDN